MNKLVQKILSMIALVTILCSTGSTAYAYTHICPPHETYVYQTLDIIESTSESHQYILEIRTLPDGRKVAVYGTCIMTTTTYLFEYRCSYCSFSSVDTGESETHSVNHQDN